MIGTKFRKLIICHGIHHTSADRERVVKRENVGKGFKITNMIVFKKYLELTRDWILKVINLLNYST